MNRQLPSLLLMLLASPVFAQVATQTGPATTTSAPTTDQSSTALRVVQIKAPPAAAPVNALQYQFLPDIVDQTPGDAVQLYYQALDMSRGDPKIFDKIQAWLDMPPDKLPRDQVRETLNQLRNPLHMIELAARTERVEWYFPIRSEGYHLMLPSLGIMRSLAKAQALRIRLEIAEGKIDDAIHDLQTGFAMARQVGGANDPFLIQSLVAMNIGTTITEQVPLLIEAPGAPNLYWALTAIQAPLVDARRGLKTEQDSLYLAYPVLLDAQRGKPTSPQDWQKALKSMDVVLASTLRDPTSAALAAVKLYPQAKQKLLERGFTPEQIEAMPVAQVVAIMSLETYQRLRDQTFKWFDVPYWQVGQGLDQADRAIGEAAARGEGQPFVSVMPSMGRVYFYQTQLDRKIAALRIVEALRMYAVSHDGQLPAALGDVTEVPIPIDPVTGKSFQYTVVGNKAVVEGPAPQGRGFNPRDGVRYELTLTK